MGQRILAIGQFDLEEPDPEESGLVGFDSDFAGEALSLLLDLLSELLLDVSAGLSAAASFL